MKSHLKALLAGGLYIFCNYVIANIPSWTVRKFLYRLCGMKIGKHSRIMMKTTVTLPWKIRIGENTTINEHCYLDGRGGLTIGDNVNIALYSMLITGSHKHRSSQFDFFTEPIVIEDGCWLAARSIVLNGSIMKTESILSAGSVLSPRSVCDAGGVYAGVPAIKTNERRLQKKLELGIWKVHFR